MSGRHGRTLLPFSRRSQRDTNEMLAEIGSNGGRQVALVIVSLDSIHDLAIAAKVRNGWRIRC